MIVKDDWSLKKKKLSIVGKTVYDVDCHAIKDLDDGEDNRESFYFVSEIETLRKKLIEDFAKWVYDDIHGDSDYSELEKIVNKRFGVDE